MVSSLLSITLNVKKQSETQKIVFLKKMHCMNPTRRQGQHGAPPTETPTVHCCSRRRGRVDGERESAREEAGKRDSAPKSLMKTPSPF